MIKKNLPVVFLLISSFVWAQDFNHYVPMLSDMPLPKDVFTPSSIKFKNKSDTIDANLKNKERSDKKQFYLETSFAMDDMLQSGYVVFNQKITSYLESLADLLLKNDPELRKKIRFFIMRSPYVNAFAHADGSIFVNIGLLAQVENEAQLAFILAHEIIHVKKMHAYNLFLYSKKKDRKDASKNVEDGSNINTESIRKHNYSKELESEADDLAIDMYLNTDYNPNALNRTYDVLKYAELPFDDIPFKKTFFESTYFKFPEAYQLASVPTAQGADENEKDDESTHPNISKRRQILVSKLKNINADNKKLYLVSEKDFSQIQTICRFELPMLHLHNTDYKDAIYEAYMLLKKYPDSEYLKKCVIQGLFYIIKTRNNNGYTPPKDPAKNIKKNSKGEIEQLNFLIAKLKNNEFNVMALRYAWKTHKEFPNNKEIKRYTNELFQELVDNHYQKKSEFLSTPPEAPAVKAGPIAPKAKIDTANLSKIDKIKVKESRTDTQAVNATNFVDYAFIEFMNDTTFTNMFASCNAIKEKAEERRKFQSSNKGRALYRDYRRSLTKKGYRLGIPKVVVVNPYYLKLENVNDKAVVKYIEGENKEFDFMKIMRDMASRTKLSIDVIDPLLLEGKETNKFNEITLLGDWLNEQLSFGDELINPGTRQQAIDSIADLYNTRYFLWTGIIQIKNGGLNGLNVFLDVISAGIFPPLTVELMYDAFKNRNEMLYFAILYDVKEGRKETIKYKYFNEKDNPTLIKSEVYDTFLQIVTKQ